MVYERILIAVIRKGASKWLVLETDINNYLSICQIFESTDDVVQYTVEALNTGNYHRTDRWLPNQTGFDKWMKIPDDRNKKD